MSSDSDSSDASPRKRKRKNNICFLDLASDQSDDSEESNSQEPVNKLTSLVRETYLSYLIRILSRHLKSTNKESSERVFSDRDIEQCARRMEQKALRSSIAAKWYQKAMLRMVAKIKNTEMQKGHSKLFDFSHSLSDKETQTESITLECSMNGNNEAQADDHQTALPSNIVNNGNVSVFSNRNVSSPTINRRPPQIKRMINNGIHINKEEITRQTHKADDEVELLFHSYSESDGSDHHDEIETAFESDPFSKLQHSSASSAGYNETEMGTNSKPAQSLDERLEALKFDRLTEIAVGEFSPENESDEINPTDLLFQEYSDNDNDDMPQTSPKSPGLSSLDRQLAEIHGETGQEPTSGETVKNNVRKPQKRLVWRYEERYYTKRLTLKLRSLTTAKRLKLERRFNELFVKGGNVSKNVAATPANDPLLQFKDRIKPWVVKHLMPHYKNGGKISTRDFFKHIARNVTDNLVANKLLPDEADVIAHINLVFNG